MRLGTRHLATRTRPESLDGAPIDKPRGVVCLGNCIDDDRLFKGRRQTEKQYEYFLRDLGFDGSDGLLKPRSPVRGVARQFVLTTDG